MSVIMPNFTKGWPGSSDEVVGKVEVVLSMVEIDRASWKGFVALAVAMVDWIFLL